MPMVVNIWSWIAYKNKKYWIHLQSKKKISLVRTHGQEFTDQLVKFNQTLLYEQYDVFVQKLANLHNIESLLGFERFFYCAHARNS